MVKCLKVCHREARVAAEVVAALAEAAASVAEAASEVAVVGDSLLTFMPVFIRFCSNG